MSATVVGYVPQVRLATRYQREISRHCARHRLRLVHVTGHPQTARAMLDAGRVRHVAVARLDHARLVWPELAVAERRRHVPGLVVVGGALGVVAAWARPRPALAVLAAAAAAAAGAGGVLWAPPPGPAGVPDPPPVVGALGASPTPAPAGPAPAGDPVGAAPAQPQPAPARTPAASTSPDPHPTSPPTPAPSPTPSPGPALLEVCLDAGLLLPLDVCLEA